MIFLNKKKHTQHTFFFEGNIHEKVNEYKYLEIDFNNKLNWEGCRKKKNLRGCKALYALQNRCRETKLWDWKTIKLLFSLIVCPTILYGGELWDSSIPISKWKQIEKIQKRLIMSKFKIKKMVRYEIMLSETWTTPMEEIGMVCLIRYLQRIEEMGEGRWPKVILNEWMSERKKLWMRQNKKWMQKMEYLPQCMSQKNKELKGFVH